VRKLSGCKGMWPVILLSAVSAIGARGQVFKTVINFPENQSGVNPNVVQALDGATSGYVTVTTPSGVLKSNVPFQVIP